MTPRTTLATDAPWPRPSDFIATILAALQREQDRLALQIKHKKKQSPDQPETSK